MQQNKQVNLVISDLNDLSEYIKNFGLLTITNRQQNQQQSQQQQRNNNNTSIEYNQFLSSRRNTSQRDHENINEENRARTRPRQTWNMPMDLDNLLPYYHTNDQQNNSTARNRRDRRDTQTTERHLFGGGVELNFFLKGYNLNFKIRHLT